MPSPAVTNRPSPPTTQSRRVLSSLDITAFTASATTPLTVVTGVMAMGYAVTGFEGLPVAFVVVGAVLAVFSVGYVAMARHLDYSGAFYTYASYGLGRPAGVSAAWVALASYNFLQVGLYGFVGAATAALLPGWLEVPWWAVAGVAWGIVAWMGLQRIKLSAGILVVLLAAEVGVVLVFVVTGLISPAGGAIVYDTLNPAAVTEPGFPAALIIAVLGFIGFESTMVYAPEARDAHRNVRRATYGVVAGATVLYVFGAWALSLASGPDEVVTQSQTQGADLMFNFLAGHLGPAALTLSRLLLVTSLLLAMISFHNTTNRYIYKLGSQRLLPKIFTVLRAKTGAPLWASVAQSTFGAIIIALFAAGGGDPVTWLFYLGGTSGAIGIIFLLATTSVAILVFFVRHPSGENVWRRIVAPSGAMIALGVIAILAVVKVDVLLGIAPDSPLRWGVPLFFVTLAVLGVVYAVALSAFNSDVYDNIGFAGKANSSAARGSQEVHQTSDVDPTPDARGWNGG
jgi:amino acid transporter